MPGQNLNTQDENHAILAAHETAAPAASADERPASRALLLEQMARGYRASRTGAALAVIVPSVLVALVPLLICIYMSVLGQGLSGDAAATIGMPLYLATLVVGLAAGLRWVRQRFAARLSRLASGQGVEIVPALLDLLRADLHPGRNRWSPLMDVLAGLLTDLLPRLRPAQATLLTDRQRATLNEVLARCARYYTLPGLKLLARRRARLFRPPLILAILRGLEQVGDASAIPYVDRLTRLPGESDAESRIREAAEACLRLLQATSERVAAARTLLRPAQPAGAPAEALLRPAAVMAETDPDTLLRPAE